MKKFLLLTMFFIIMFSINKLKSQTVDSIVLVRDSAGRPEWSPNGNQLIAYHKKEADDFYDIHIMDNNGLNDTCITCNHPSLPGRHAGGPIWHPSGQWIIFRAEKASYYSDSTMHGYATPGIGWNNDIYIISMVTGAVFQLTNLDTKMSMLDPTPYSGVLTLRFTPDGNHLSWSERINSGGHYNWGEYVIRYADFAIVNDTPHISNIQTIQPAAGRYMESNSFSADGQTMYICGNLDSNQTELGIDLYSYNFNSQQTFRITESLDAFDESAHISPQDNRIAYLSSEGFPQDTSNISWWEWMKGEFWFIDPDGTNKQQITHFNTSGYPEYTGKRTIPAWITWDEAGNTLLAGVSVQILPAYPSILIDRIYKIYLSGTSVTDNFTTIHPVSVFPNPATQSATIIFCLPTREYVVLKLYDVTGKEIKTIADSYFDEGEHKILFKSDNLPDGIYHLKLQTNSSIQTKILEVIK